MTALSMSAAQPVRAAASASVAATVQQPAAAPLPAAITERFSQVSPESALNVATETVAAIQQLGSSSVATEAEEQADLRSFQEFQAEARSWERYFAHQPRRLQDLLAVYYGSLPGSTNSSIDPRGAYPQDIADKSKRSYATADGDREAGSQS